jgi:hypothetical protein
MGCTAMSPVEGSDDVMYPLAGAAMHSTLVYPQPKDVLPGCVFHTMLCR